MGRVKYRVRERILNSDNYTETKNKIKDKWERKTQKEEERDIKRKTEREGFEWEGIKEWDKFRLRPV